MEKWITLKTVGIMLPESIEWIIRDIYAQPYNNDYLSLSGFTIVYFSFHGNNMNKGYLHLKDQNNELISLSLSIELMQDRNDYELKALITYRSPPKEG